MEPADQPALVRSAADARHLLAPLFEGAAAEKIAVLHLDGDGRLLALREYPGSVDEVELPTRAIIADALRLGSSGLIVAHNHPSGDAQPSEQDLRVSRILADTARNLGIRFVDHLIFAGSDTLSLRNLGLL